MEILCIYIYIWPCVAKALSPKGYVDKGMTEGYDGGA